MVSELPFAPPPHRHLPKQVKRWFHSDSSKRCLGFVGDATIHERAVPIFRQLPWLVLQHTHVQQQRVSSTEQSFEPQYPFTVAADQVVEHTSNVRNLVVSAQHS